MLVRSSWRRWARLPGRIALLLGLGAVSAVGAQAAAPADRTDPGPQTKIAADAPILRLHDGRLYLSEDGRAFAELRLGDTAEARRLRELLERAGGDGIRLSPTILAGSGGCGFHWTPADTSDNGTPSNAASTRQKS